MNLELLVVSCFVSIVLVILLAGHILNQTVWRWCYRCRVWHNQIGERHSVPPMFGQIGGVCLCERCQTELHDEP
jgi:hypothetical protein